MSSLSEVSLLIAQNANDLDNARDVFTTDIRRFTEDVLESLRKARSEPWMNGRVRIDLPREIENEPKSAAYLLSNQFAKARASLRFKKGTKFVVIAEVAFGIGFDEASTSCCWQLDVVPASKYIRLDDRLWSAWKASGATLPGAAHLERANVVRFVARPVSSELTRELAFAETKAVLEFLLGAFDALAESVGVEPEEDSAA